MTTRSTQATRFNMFSSLSLIIFIALVFGSSGAVAQNTATQNGNEQGVPQYRVELIVFSHNKGRSDGYRTTDLNDFSETLDPLRLAEAEQAAAEALGRFQRLSGIARNNGGAEPIDPETEPTDVMPEPYIAQAELSEPMQTVLERLDRSGAYQPLAWRVWYQTAERGERTRWVRLHDQQLIDSISMSEPDEFDDLLNLQTGSDAVADDPAAIEHYRLDGQTRLRQRQFLHLHFDLEWREPAGRPAPILEPGSSMDRPRIEPASIDQPPVWRVHSFEQSRIVRVDRIEYFDSEWLGVVALLTRVEPPEPEEAAESEVEPIAGGS